MFALCDRNTCEREHLQHSLKRKERKPDGRVVAHHVHV